MFDDHFIIAARASRGISITDLDCFHIFVAIICWKLRAASGGASPVDSISFSRDERAIDSWTEQRQTRSSHGEIFAR